MNTELSSPATGESNTGTSVPPHNQPSQPDLVLRIGFAGNRELSDDPKQLEKLKHSLEAVFLTLAQKLAEFASIAPVEGGMLGISRFYSRERPKLRLVTGLAEGADTLAAQALLSLASKNVHRELAAVLPFEIKAYRESRSAAFRPVFDELARKCSYILTLDGRYEAGEAGKRFRSRAYRAQSTVLLRHADIVLVALDPDKESKSGGTMETIHAALAFDLPVVFIHAATGAVRLLESGTDLVSALSGEVEPTATPDWETTLREWAANIVAEPDAGSNPQSSQDGALNPSSTAHGQRLLYEFFDREQTPPINQISESTLERRKSLRERLWTHVESWFRPKDAPNSLPDPPLEPYTAYRHRATALNYHFSGLYRGTFVLNYVLAVAAVALAAFSLVLLGKTHTAPAAFVGKALENKSNEVTAATGPTNAIRAILTPNEASSTASHAPTSSPEVFIILLVLGAMKLAIVVLIFRNTHQANHGDWNDKAVDYRYLAERLRTLFYLPRVGGFQPPAASPPQYASRVVRQSAVDWLFEAVVRSVSPASFARSETVSLQGGKSYTIPVIRLDAGAVLADIRDRWLGGQIAYHSRNARTMARLYEFADRWGRRLNITVIAVVVMDVLAIFLVEVLHLFPGWKHSVEIVAPALVFLAALLPAAVASLNGIRFQSECRRLSDRSAVVHAILGGREKSPHVKGRLQETMTLIAQFEAARKIPASDPGAWSVEALHLAEKIASDLVQEVAEWSVLYAKEVVEP